MTLLTEPTPWRLVATDPPPLRRQVLGADPGMPALLVERRPEWWIVTDSFGMRTTRWVPMWWMEIPTAPMEAP